MDAGNITVHGFRSTFRDWASETTAFPHEVCEQALRAYHQQQDRSGLQAWRLV